MQKTVVFIDVPPDCVQHKLLIYFFRRTIVEPAEVFVLLDISFLYIRNFILFLSVCPP